MNDRLTEANNTINPRDNGGKYWEVTMHSQSIVEVAPTRDYGVGYSGVDEYPMISTILGEG